jgi:CRISPR-associated protein Csm5
MAKQHYTLTVIPLTGVHIGTGDEITPLDYKIAEAKSGTKRYFRFSYERILNRLIKEHHNLSAFEEASVAGNMQELQAFFQKSCTASTDFDYSCDVTKNFRAAYNKHKDPYENAAKVFPMYHSENSARPVIPGSSLKGSIRTALLNWRLEDMRKRAPDEYNNLKHIVNPKKDEQMIQHALFKYNDPKDDPLRCVSISDCVFSATGTQLVGLLKNISAMSDGTLSVLDKLQIQAEVIKGRLLGGAASAKTNLTVDADLQNTRQISLPITAQTILTACNYFYMREFAAEYDFFYQDACDSAQPEITAIEKLKDLLESASKKPNQCVIRVGRWSQVKFVTFEEQFRQPKTSKNKFGK